ncbi:MAG: septum formation initiator family protein [Brevinematales bacterium]|nr:septum formation initiator family protein [Brevinematales bacterium]
MKSEIMFSIVVISVSILALVVSISFVFSRGGIIDTIKKEREIAYLKEQVVRLEKMNQDKKKQLEMLKNDVEYRKSITKGLGIDVEEGEYVFRFEDYKGNVIIDSQKPQSLFIDKISLFIAVIFSIQVLVFLLILSRYVIRTIKDNRN